MTEYRFFTGRRWTKWCEDGSDDCTVYRDGVHLGFLKDSEVMVGDMILGYPTQGDSEVRSRVIARGTVVELLELEPVLRIETRTRRASSVERS